MSRVISDSASVRQIALQSVTQSVTGTVVIIGSDGSSEPPHMAGIKRG